MKKIGVLLSGCGVFDGTEIHEAVLALLSIDRAGAEAVCMAPSIAQHHVVNHATGKETTGETRNTLIESARIARGNIRDVATLSASELDALILPGGYGAVKNLCDFAAKGALCTAHREVARLVREMHALRKPLGFICIAPALAARVLGESHPLLTIGKDTDTAKAMEQMGARHAICEIHQFIEDPDQKIVSTPAYMLDARIREVADGIDKLVRRIVEMA